ncbi:nitroreductase family protein [Belliella sp. R4-6]|uniref:Nitroreductase family protein n=1 Tax=Belliella alkalica TaxID=1730871 RepID=A0ABS9VF27_9BACT|nr:nitroreductase family protein [Belliella alkalica]MCH7414630.1 nitroreductase family protein [Belliella alkalica]
MLKSLLKKIIPERGIWFLAESLESFKFFINRIIKSNTFFVAISLSFNKNYIREHKAFLEGAFIYENSRKKNSLNIHFLRRNVHRIEKGMIMRPRRSEFAVRFIYQTVVAFKVLVENNKNDFLRSEFDWSFQVLDQYFKIVSSQNVNYIKANEIFKSLSEHFNVDKATVKLPFPNSNAISKVTFDDFLDLNISRKSVRWFSKKTVPSELINKALNVALQSPSSCNRLPYRYFISNTDLKLTNEIANVSPGTIGWSENIPAIAVLVGQQRAFSNVANRHSIYVDSCLSVMPFVLALESLGLRTCLINWADIPENEDKMKGLLGLGEDEKVIVSIAIGYPEHEGYVAYSQRKYINEISQFI